MRKQIFSSLKKKAVSAMSSAAPEYAVAKIKNSCIGSKEIVFRKIVEGAHVFVIFVPKDSDGESFTVELAWSRQGRFPELGMRPSCTPSRTGEERSAVEGAVRLPELISGRDDWWDAVPLDASSQDSVMRYIAFQMQPLSEADADALVAPLVSDAIKAVTEHGLPYLYKIA